MGIQQIEVYEVTLAYREPFVIAKGRSTETHNIIVKVSTDYDSVGWGEASPSRRVTGETADTVVSALDRIGPKLIGSCPLRIELNVEVMDSLVMGNYSAKAAVDIALHDILGKTAHKPLFMVMGGYRTEVQTDITLSIKPPKDMANDALVAVQNGFTALKVKVGTDPTEDLERVETIRKVVGDQVQIRVDANQGWTLKQAIEALGRMEKFEIQFAEQPVAADDIKGMREIRKSSPIPIMADESVHSPEDMLRLVQAEAMDLVNIKLMKCGGILKARRIVAIAEAGGLPCMIGCMAESEVGIAAGAHLAASAKNIRYADLDSDLLLKDNLTDEAGAGIKGSMRVFTRRQGLGLGRLNQGLMGKPLRVYK